MYRIYCIYAITSGDSHNKHSQEPEAQDSHCSTQPFVLFCQSCRRSLFMCKVSCGMPRLTGYSIGERERAICEKKGPHFNPRHDLFLNLIKPQSFNLTAAKQKIIKWKKRSQKSQQDTNQGSPHPRQWLNNVDVANFCCHPVICSFLDACFNELLFHC